MPTTMLDGYTNGVFQLVETTSREFHCRDSLPHKITMGLTHRIMKDNYRSTLSLGVRSDGSEQKVGT
jgi:hypothetical protein